MERIPTLRRESFNWKISYPTLHLLSWVAVLCMKRIRVRTPCTFLRCLNGGNLVISFSCLFDSMSINLGNFVLNYPDSLCTNITVTSAILKLSRKDC